MKRTLIPLFLVLSLAVCLLESCNVKDGEISDMSQISGKTYKWEKPGFGSDFTLTLNEDGTYQYYAGALSSYIGIGNWTLENGVVKLNDNETVFQFKIEDDGLTFLSEGSGAFMHVDVKDGDRFLPTNEVVASDSPSIEGPSGSSDSPASSYTQISQEEAQRMMEVDDGHIILDVRRQDEYNSGHIPGAICIPNETIGAEMPKELPDLNQVILVYCRSGRRSKEAAQKLYEIGYTHVFEFGGIIDWTGETTVES